LHLIVAGLNHRTAPIELRERIAFTEARLPAALAALSSNPGVREAAIVSTCNRTEIYARMSSREDAREALLGFLANHQGIAREQFESHLYVHYEEDAVRHLLRVASGLDSLVLGEPQVLHQVRQAQATAQHSGTLGTLLHGLFRAAIFAGRRARTETHVSAGGFSIGHAAVDHSRSIFGELRGASILVLGAGKMSELTAKHLVANGVEVVFVANRTFERAQALAGKLGGTAVNYEEFPDHLVRTDIVISSTAAPIHVLTREMLLPILRRRRGRPLFLIDIAVPRDIEPSIGGLDNVFLYDVDDLQNVVADMARERSSEVERVEALISEEVKKFEAWWRTLTVAPVVSQIKKKHEAIRQEELARLRNQMPDLPESAWRNIDSALRSFMNKAHRDAVHRIKEATDSTSDPAQYDLVEAARELFGLEEEDTSAEAQLVEEALERSCTAPIPWPEHPADPQDESVVEEVHR
jgi:glutamyl-tRNA reductase